MSHVCFSDRSFKEDSSIRCACAELPSHFLAITLSRIHCQNSGGAIRVAYRPRPLIQAHVFGEIAIKDRERSIFSLAIGRVERRMKQDPVKVDAHTIEGRTPYRK